MQSCVRLLHSPCKEFCHNYIHVLMISFIVHILQGQHKQLYFMYLVISDQHATEVFVGFYSLQVAMTSRQSSTKMWAHFQTHNDDSASLWKSPTVK